MEVRILTASDVKTALPMPKAIDAMRLAFGQFSTGRTTVPLRRQIATDMDGNSLTAIRTGAGGGLAAELLSRKDAAVVALFGAGVQARAQLRGVMAVRRIRQVNLS